jgi:hypothetical protein
MRVTAAEAPRVASGDPAASKGKSADGASFRKRRVGQERGAQPPTLDRPLPILCIQFWSASRTGQLYVIAWPSVEGTSTALRVWAW